jgi:hypothetical protein
MLDEFADAAPRKRRKKTGEKATVETPACRWMKERGWYHKKYKSIGSRSAPDRIFAKDGMVFFCEFKKKDKRPTDLQYEEHEKMRSFGLFVVVFDNLEDFKSYVIQLEGDLRKYEEHRNA